MTAPEKQLLIRFKDIRIVQLTMTIPDHRLKKAEELEIQLDFDPIFHDDNLREFDVKFLIKIVNKENTFLFEAQALAMFATSDSIDDDFKKSAFALINAPAIAFPYLRAFISTVTLNSGIDPVVLPAFNFTNNKNIADRNSETIKE